MKAAPEFGAAGSITGEITKVTDSIFDVNNFTNTLGLNENLSGVDTAIKEFDFGE